MQVSSGGESIVFDAKTQKAIDEGKNRVTMLSAETVRLHDLKVDLEGQIVRLNTDMADKESRLERASESLAELETAIFNATEQLNATNKLYIDTQDRVNALETSIKEREAACTAKELSLNERADFVDERERKAAISAFEIETSRQGIEKKKMLIEELVSKL